MVVDGVGFGCSVEMCATGRCSLNLCCWLLWLVVVEMCACRLYTSDVSGSEVRVDLGGLCIVLLRFCCVLDCGWCGVCEFCAVVL